MPTPVRVLAVIGVVFLGLSLGARTAVRAGAPTHIITTFAGGGLGDGGPATAAGLSLPSKVVVANGDLYISDSRNCAVRRVHNGVISTVAGVGICLLAGPEYSGEGGPATMAQIAPQGLAVDPAGNVYIGTGCAVRVVTAGVITTIAGSLASCGSDGDGVPPTVAHLSRNISALAFDAGGNLYIADTSNCLVRKIEGGVIRTVAGNRCYGPGGMGVPATESSLENPTGVAVDLAGNLFVADQYDVKLVSGGIVSQFDYGYQSLKDVSVDASGTLYTSDSQACRIYAKPAAGVRAVIAGTGTCGLGSDGPATAAALLYPDGVASISDGTVYFADTWGCRVRAVSGGVISTVAGIPSWGGCGYTGDGGPPAQAGLSRPDSIAVDGTGNVYIGEGWVCRVRKISGGVITTIAGNGSCYGSTISGTNATAASISPTSLATYGDDLYIADATHCTLWRVHAGIIYSAAGPGASCLYGGTGQDGVAIDAAGDIYYSSSGYVYKVLNGTLEGIAVGGPEMAFGSDGKLYLASSGDCKVSRLDGTTLTTVVGHGCVSGCCPVPAYGGDGGPARDASLGPIGGIAFDRLGAMYIADPRNCRIRRVLGGTIDTVAGTGTCGLSGDGGPATAANIYSNYGVAVDSNGSLLEVELFNNRVRAVSNLEVDTDGDGLPDEYEQAHPCLNPTVPDAGADPDLDGATSLAEFRAWTDPCIPDTDGDGMPDGYELAHSCLNPFQNDAAQDTDGDGLTNLQESSLGTDACNSDTSGDGYTDAQKVALGKNPLVYCPMRRADVDGDGVVSIIDLTIVASAYMKPVPPAPPRYDQGPRPVDNVITILDLSRMARVFGQPIAACP